MCVKQQHWRPGLSVTLLERARKYCTPELTKLGGGGGGRRGEGGSEVILHF